MHVGEAFQPRQLLDLDAAQPAHPAQIVAQKVDDHQVFGLVLFAVDQVAGQLLVLGRSPAPGPGSLDRPGRDMAAGRQFQEPFRRGRCNGHPRAGGQIGPERRRRQGAQAAIEHERGKALRPGAQQTLRQVGLEDVAGVDIGNGARNQVFVMAAAQLGPPAPRRPPIDRRKRRRGGDPGRHGLGPGLGRWAHEGGIEGPGVGGEYPGVAGLDVEGGDGVVKPDDQLGKIEAGLQRRRQALQVAAQLVAQITDGAALKGRQVRIASHAERFKLALQDPEGIALHRATVHSRPSLGGGNDAERIGGDIGVTPAGAGLGRAVQKRRDRIA